MATVEVAQQQLLIGGEWTDASAGGTYEKKNPYTGEVTTTAAAAKREDARAAVEAAQKAFPAWSSAAPAERAAVLNRAAELLTERAEDIAATVTQETGGTFGWGMFNVQLALGMLQQAA